MKKKKLAFYGRLKIMNPERLAKVYTVSLIYTKYPLYINMGT